MKGMAGSGSEAQPRRAARPAGSGGEQIAWWRHARMRQSNAVQLFQWTGATSDDHRREPNPPSPPLTSRLISSSILFRFASARPAAALIACCPASAARETVGGCSLSRRFRHGASACAHPEAEHSRWPCSVQVLRRPALREEAAGHRRLPPCRQGRRRRLVLGRAGVVHLHHRYRLMLDGARYLFPVLISK